MIAFINQYLVIQNLPLLCVKYLYLKLKFELKMYNYIFLDFMNNILLYIIHIIKMASIAIYSSVRKKRKIYKQAVQEYTEYRNAGKEYKIISNTIYNTIPNTILNTIPNTIPNTIHNTIPNTIPNTISDTIPNTISDTILKTEHNKLPNITVSEIHSKIVPRRHELSRRHELPKKKLNMDDKMKTVNDTILHPIPYRRISPDIYNKIYSYSNP